MEKGKISIVIPAYNAENTIGRLLDQFFMQTYTDLEIIVVNDGSTDNTRSVCERIKDKRVSLFNITITDRDMRVIMVLTGRMVSLSVFAMQTMR